MSIRGRWMAPPMGSFVNASLHPDAVFHGEQLRHERIVDDQHVVKSLRRGLRRGVSSSAPLVQGMNGFGI
jgi:hypothetical protein